MTTTYSIDAMSGTGADVSMEKLADASFAEQITEVIPNGQRTTYLLPTSDDKHQVRLVIQSKLDKNGNGGQGVRTALIALNSWVRVQNTDQKDELSPISTVLTINFPIGTGLPAAFVRSQLEILYSTTFSTLTTKEPDNNRLTSLVLHGLTDVMG